MFPDRLRNHNNSHDTISLIVSLYLIGDKRVLPRKFRFVYIMFIGAVFINILPIVNIKSLENTFAHLLENKNLRYDYNLSNVII